MTTESPGTTALSSCDATVKRAYAFILLSAAGVASFSVVDVVYFQTVGYSLAFIGLMSAAFNFAVSAAELPFAVLFDQYSNKLALQIGNGIRIAAFAVFFLNMSAESLVLAQVIAGVGVAASSGTSSALIINQINTSRPDDISRAFGRITYLSAAAGMLGGVVGVAAFSIEPRLIWATAIGFCATAGVVIFGFTDTRARIERLPWRVYGRSTLAVVRKRSTVVLVLTNGSAVAPFILWQVKFDLVSLLFVLFGFLLMNTARVIGPFVIGRIGLGTGKVRLVAFANVAAAALFGLAGSPWIIAATFFLHVLLHTVLLVLVSGSFHAEISDDIRATAGSVVSLLDSLVVAFMAPAVAWAGQTFGLEYGIIISGVLYTAVALLVGSGKGWRRIEVKESS